MDVVMTRCAGLDVHQATVVATVRVPDDQGGRRVVTDTFGTMTADLLALRDWLHAYGVTHVALESTGVGADGHCGTPPAAFREAWVIPREHAGGSAPAGLRAASTAVRGCGRRVTSVQATQLQLVTARP